MKRLKRILVMVVGGSVLLVGVALMVLPGPAFLVIPFGLAILAAEFAWARRWLRSARAVVPLTVRGGFTSKKKITLQSVRRSLEFLVRQVRRTLRRKPTPCASRL
jgi:hypothetical protein